MWKIVRSKQKMLDKIVRKENNVTRSGMAADMLCSRNATTCCVSAARKKTAKLQLSKDVRRWVKSDFFFFGEDRLWVKSDFFFFVGEDRYEPRLHHDACHGCARFSGASCVGLACLQCLAGNERLNLTLLSTDRVTRRNTQIQRRVRAREPGSPVETTRSDRKSHSNQHSNPVNRQAS